MRRFDDAFRACFSFLFNNYWEVPILVWYSLGMIEKVLSSLLFLFGCMFFISVYYLFAAH